MPVHAQLAECRTMRQKAGGVTAGLALRGKMSQGSNVVGDQLA